MTNQEDVMIKKLNISKILLMFLAAALLVPPASCYADGRDRREDRHYYRYHDRPSFGMRVGFVPENAFIVDARGGRYYYYDGLYYNRMGAEYVLIDPPIGAVVATIPPDYVPVVVNGVMYYTDRGIFYVRTRYGYQVVPRPVIVAQPVMVQQPVVFQQPVQVREVESYQPNQTKVAEGAGLGGIFGALLGGVIGHQQKGHHELGGALIGGAAGAVAGGIVGAQIPNENAPQPVRTVVQTVPQAVPQATPEESFTVNIRSAQGGYKTVIIKRVGNGFVGPQGEYYTEFPRVAQLEAMYAR